MGFVNWLKERFTREENEEIRINSQDPNILCDEYCESMISRWLEEENLRQNGLSEFLKFFEFKMPIRLNGLKLWEKTSVICTDVTGRKAVLIFEHFRREEEGRKLIIEEEGRVPLDYTTEEIKEIVDFYS